MENEAKKVREPEAVNRKECVKCSRAVEKKCIYGVKVDKFIACDYISKTKRRRPCSPNACTVYQKRGKKHE